MAKYLDKDGLTRLWSKIKNLVTDSVDAAKTAVGNCTVNGKKISTNPTLTKADVGLGSVDNVRQIPLSEKGAAGGVAELDEEGRVPTAQLPSYVDDVVEFHGTVENVTAQMMSLSKPMRILYDTAKKVFVASDNAITGEGGRYYVNWAANDDAGIPMGDAYGEATDNGRKPVSGKIYVDASANRSYRWGGSGLTEITGGGLTLGTTSSTAFRGDQGKAAYDHAQAKGSAFASGLYRITVNAEGHVTAAVKVTKADITALGIPGQDTTYAEATQSVNGLMGAADKKKLDGVAAGATADGALTTAEIDAVCV